MELNVSVHSVFCFTLLFECVLQGNVVCRWLVQGGELPSGVGMFDRDGCGFMAVVGAWGLGWCLGNVKGCTWTQGWDGSGMDKLQQWGAGGGCEGAWGCGFVTKWTHGCHRVPQQGRKGVFGYAFRICGGLFQQRQ